MVTVICRDARSDFCIIPIGEFFITNNELYLKYSSRYGLNFTTKGPQEFNPFDLVEPVDVEIKVN